MIDDLMYEVYIKDQENLRFIFIVFLELNIKCKFLIKIYSDSIVFGFGIFLLEVVEIIIYFLIKLKVLFECEQVSICIYLDYVMVIIFLV